MNYFSYIIVSFVFALTLWSCNDDLEVPPQNNLTDETYWSSETNVRTFSLGFYQAYFWGYGESYAWGDFFSGETLNDEFGASSPGQFVQQVPTAGGGWGFAWVRKANIMIDRVQTVPMDEEAIAHWTGIGRFFRAMEYADLVERFGDVPWYSEVINQDDEELLLKARDSRDFRGNARLVPRPEGSQKFLESLESLGF